MSKTYALLLIILAAELTVGCGDDQVSSEEIQNSSSSGDDSSSSGGDGSSSGEDSSSGPDLPEEPSPQPEEGRFSPCLIDEDCPYSNWVCWREQGWDRGFCTAPCGTADSCVWDGHSQAELSCGIPEDESGGHMCLLRCAHTDQCPIGMICRLTTVVDETQARVCT